MSYFVEFQLPDGTPMLVEMAGDPPTTPGAAPASRSGNKVVVKSNKDLETAVQRVRPAAELLLDTLRGLSNPPTEIELEFGLSLSVEAGVILTRGSMDANYKVKLKWTKAEAVGQNDG